MIKTVGLIALVVGIVLVIADDSWAQLQVQPDKQNVVGSRLEGQWELDTGLTKRLGGSELKGLAFNSDAAVAAKIPQKYDETFKGKQIYMAGTMTRAEKEHPFVLVEMNGNPYIICFGELKGDALGDFEAFIVMLAVGKDKQDDLLFTGGDFNNQTFTAYRRARTESE